MRTGLLLACVAWIQLGAAARAGAAARGERVHRIAVALRGPVAVVDVTRTLGDPDSTGRTSEQTLDIALPDGAALLSVEISDGGPWRKADAIPVSAARDVYRQAMESRGISAGGVAFRPWLAIDDPFDYQIRVARGAGHRAAPVTVRYRFSALVEYAEGRQRLRFPLPPIHRRRPPRSR